MKRLQGSPTKLKPEANFDVVEDKHLGGCAKNGDGATYYPAMWTHLVEKYNIKSVVDVGCGFGHSTDFFYDDLKCEVRGVEGLQRAVDENLVSSEFVVQHDFETGPYIPERKFDLCWSCEFVEHVSHESMPNFLETFKSADYLAITYASPGQGGHNHVNEQEQTYWLQHIEQAGFEFDWDTTLELREIAKQDCEEFSPFYESHFIKRGLFFKKVGL